MSSLVPLVSEKVRKNIFHGDFFDFEQKINEIAAKLVTPNSNNENFRYFSIFERPYLHDQWSDFKKFFFLSYLSLLRLEGNARGANC